MVEDGTNRQWLRPKNDFVFKLLFGNNDKTSLELLTAFLTDLLDVPEKSVKSVEIMNPIFGKESLLDKSSIFDIHARITGGTRINIEIQLANQYNIEKRTMYYGSKMIAAQLSEGNNYKRLCKVMTVNLIDFDYFLNDHYRSRYVLSEERTGEPYSDLFQLEFIEMKKFIRQQNAGTIELTDRLAKWLQFLTNEDDDL